MNQSPFITVGDVARIARVPLYRMTYALQRRQIQEDARAGVYRLFRRERLGELLQALKDVGQGERATAPKL